MEVEEVAGVETPATDECHQQEIGGNENKLYIKHKGKERLGSLILQCNVASIIVSYVRIM